MLNLTAETLANMERTLRFWGVEDIQILAITACIQGGYLVHYLIERPTLDRMDRQERAAFCAPDGTMRSGILA